MKRGASTIGRRDDIVHTGTAFASIAIQCPIATLLSYPGKFSSYPLVQVRTQESFVWIADKHGSRPRWIIHETCGFTDIVLVQIFQVAVYGMSYQDGKF
eukprot:scaffold45105_cov275-Amphora_coffeaeformis.AAC.4